MSNFDKDALMRTIKYNLLRHVYFVLLIDHNNFMKIIFFSVVFIIFDLAVFYYF